MLKNSLKVLFLGLVILAAQPVFVSAGEPVPGAEILIEQEPPSYASIRDLTVPNVVGLAFANLKEATLALQKDPICQKPGRSSNCQQLTMALKRQTLQVLQLIKLYRMETSMAPSVNNYGINDEGIK